MTTPDLDVLGALTRDYAAFQSRKSGLATALGGLMAILLALAALSPDLMGARVTGRLLVEYLVWMPFLWLALKWGVGRVLYRGLGPVKPSPDAAYERRRWFWIQGLALFLLAFLLAGLYAFASGLMQVNPSRAALCPPPLWMLLMPFLYLLPAPWVLRGIEEARAYVVLVGQCMLWLVPFFLLSFWPPRSASLPAEWGRFGDLSGIGMVGLILLILVWGALAMIRGWREHHQYLAILRALPRES